MKYLATAVLLSVTVSVAMGQQIKWHKPPCSKNESQEVLMLSENSGPMIPVCVTKQSNIRHPKPHKKPAKKVQKNLFIDGTQSSIFGAAPHHPRVEDYNPHAHVTLEQIRKALGDEEHICMISIQGECWIIIDQDPLPISTTNAGDTADIWHKPPCLPDEEEWAITGGDSGCVQREHHSGAVEEYCSKLIGAEYRQCFESYKNGLDDEGRMLPKTNAGLPAQTPDVCDTAHNCPQPKSVQEPKP